MEPGPPRAREVVNCIRVRSEQELNSLRVGSELEQKCLRAGNEQELNSPRAGNRHPGECVRQEALEHLIPKREPEELPEHVGESTEQEGFEFIGVKHEPLEDPADNEFLPQEPECILEQKDEVVVDVRTGKLPPTQEPECIIVQKGDLSGRNLQPGEVGPTQVHENGIRQEPPDIPGRGGVKEEEEILGLEVEWVPPRVPADDEASRDHPASEGDAVTDSTNEEFYNSTGWRHTPCENRHTSPREVNYYRLTVDSGGPPSDARVSRSCGSDGTEPLQRVFRCDSCSAIFSSKYNLVIHVFTHIAEVPPPSHVCRWCGEVFCDTLSLIKHSKGHENRPEVPTVSFKKSRGSGRTVNGEKQHRAQKPLEMKPRICDLCGKVFTTLGNLNLHKRTHTGERPYVCDVCGKAFVQSVHLQNHRTTHTAERRYYCASCGRGFTLLHTLKVHVRMHTGENPYSCEVCGAAFNLLGKLKTHQQIHTGRKPYECDECGNFFAAPNSLRRHKRMHSGEKPFRCDTCGESFMWSATLQRHKQQHTGVKPFKCDLCTSAFPEMGGLTRHMRIHTGERPFACDICGASFTASNHLKRHRRGQHVENRVALNV